jgi:hypothetical protein
MINLTLYRFSDVYIHLLVSSSNLKQNIFFLCLLYKTNHIHVTLIGNLPFSCRIQEELSAEKLHLLNSEKKLLILEKDKVLEEVHMHVLKAFLIF